MAMARRRARRPASAPAIRIPVPADDRKLVLILTVLFIALTGVSLLAYRIKYPPHADAGTDARYPSPNPLVKTDVHYQDILAEHLKLSENASTRNFFNPVLAYVTPWNSKGYELAKKFSSRLTHISPVWYQVKSQDGTLAIEGRHNADEGWMSELRMRGNSLILPRVVLEADPSEYLSKRKQRSNTIKLIVTECKEMGYDGVVLESWSWWMAYGILHDESLRALALQFVRDLGFELHSVNSEKNAGQHLQLIYVIGPPQSEKLEMHDFGPTDLQSLSGVVDGFSLMTYDFSGPQTPGPNAPLNWIRHVLKVVLGDKQTASPRISPKIFLGINFYGNDFILSGGGRAITGADYLSLLENHRPSLQWDKNSAEHFFMYPDSEGVNHAVFYPSLMSIFMRLKEAKSWEIGISIWEIGQGLDYFFDLL